MGDVVGWGGSDGKGWWRCGQWVFLLWGFTGVGVVVVVWWGGVGDWKDVGGVYIGGWFGRGLVWGCPHIEICMANSLDVGL